MLPKSFLQDNAADYEAELASSRLSVLELSNAESFVVDRICRQLSSANHARTCPKLMLWITYSGEPVSSLFDLQLTSVNNWVDLADSRRPTTYPLA